MLRCNVTCAFKNSAISVIFLKGNKTYFCFILLYFYCRRGPTKYIRNWEDVTAYGREKFRGNPRGNFGGRRGSGGRFRGAPRFRGRGRKEFISDDSGQKSYLSENAEDQEEPSPKEDTGN